MKEVVMLKNFLKACILAGLVMISSFSFAEITQPYQINKDWQQVLIPNNYHHKIFIEGEDGSLYMSAVQNNKVVRSFFKYNSNRNEMIFITHAPDLKFDNFVVDKLGNIYSYSSGGAMRSKSIMKYSSANQWQSFYSLIKGATPERLSIKDGCLFLLNYLPKYDNRDLLMFDIKTNNNKPMPVFQSNSNFYFYDFAVKDSKKVFVYGYNHKVNQRQMLELMYKNGKWNPELVLADVQSNTRMLATQKNLYMLHEDFGCASKYNFDSKLHSNYEILEGFDLDALQTDAAENVYFGGRGFDYEPSAVFKVSHNSNRLVQVGGRMIDQEGKPENKPISNLTIINNVIYASINGNLYKYQQ